MPALFVPWWRVAAVALAVYQVALAQTCYYPNGKEADKEEKPCSSEEGSACCPSSWVCLDNGLCHYPPTKLWGRYSCTDKDWNSPGCASNMCTYGMTVAGGESITQCSDHDDQWCCNGDATNVNCCKESPSPRPFFRLQDGNAYATIGRSTARSNPTLSSVTGLASESGSSSSSSSSSTSSSSSSGGGGGVSRTSSPSSTSVTSTLTSVASGTSGPTTILSTVTTQIPAASSSAETPEPTPEKTSKTRIIIGCAVGVPLAVALIGVLIWLLRKRSQQKHAALADKSSDPYTNGDSSPEFIGGAAFSKPSNGPAAYQTEPNGNVAELGGQSIGAGRPVSTAVKGVSELASGPGFVPGTTPHSPHFMGVGGGNGHAPAHTPQSSWGSAPPDYSPLTNQSNWAQRLSTVSSIDAAPHTGGGRYIPYRPPQAAVAPMPEVAELPVNTPPELVEMPNNVTTPPASTDSTSHTGLTPLPLRPHPPPSST